MMSEEDYLRDFGPTHRIICSQTNERSTIVPIAKNGGKLTIALVWIPRLW